ncbi:MAG: hypothetical protein NXY57DRAFT_892074, partial [Lentinula lateritia]
NGNVFQEFWEPPERLWKPRVHHLKEMEIDAILVRLQVSNVFSGSDTILLGYRVVVHLFCCTFVGDPVSEQAFEP